MWTPGLIASSIKNLEQNRTNKLLLILYTYIYIYIYFKASDQHHNFYNGPWNHEHESRYYLLFYSRNFKNLLINLSLTATIEETLINKFPNFISKNKRFTPKCSIKFRTTTSYNKDDHEE